MSSTILQEAEVVEPTRDEILEYAMFLGMELPRDDHLLWIATEGLKAPLPPRWKPVKSADGEIYYFNFKTGESQWEHPCDQVAVFAPCSSKEILTFRIVL
jgi:hypothetical protein